MKQNQIYWTLLRLLRFNDNKSLNVKKYHEFIFGYNCYMLEKYLMNEVLIIHLIRIVIVMCIESVFYHPMSNSSMK